jgi:magnesium transporter
MIKTAIHGSTTWFHITSPTSEELTHLADTYHISPNTVSELLSESVMPKITSCSNYIYISIRFLDDEEVDFILGHNFIITVTYEHQPAIDELHSSIHKEISMKDRKNNPGIFFYHIMSKLYYIFNNEVTRLRTHIKHIEDSVYSGEEQEMVFALAKAGREILDIRQSLDPHKDILNSFEQTALKFYGKKYISYIQTLHAELYKITQRIKRISALQKELRATNDSLLSIKQNSIMKVFTIIAFVTLIPSLIAGIFGMNIKYMPMTTEPADFWYIMIIMGLFSIFSFLFFKYKKWL